MSAPMPDPSIALKKAANAITGYLISVWGLAVLIGSLAVYLAFLDRSWGAAWIALIGCPAINLGLMICSLISAASVGTAHPAIPKTLLYSSAFFAPVVSAGVAFGVIIMMDLHGC